METLHCDTHQHDAGNEKRKKQQVEWLTWQASLEPYRDGSKDWNTGCPWVCESHPEFPHEQGYTFDCPCGAPGMPPLKHEGD